MPKLIHKLIELDNSKKLVCNTKYEFDVPTPKNHQLVAGQVVTGVGDVRDRRIRDGKITLRIVGPAVPVRVFLIAVFEKIDKPVVESSEKVDKPVVESSEKVDKPVVVESSGT